MASSLPLIMAQTQTSPTKKRRGRPSKKSPGQLLRIGESTMEISVNGSLNTPAHNSAAMAKLALSTTTPVMKLSPQRRKSNSNSSTSTPTKRPRELSTIPEGGSTQKTHNMNFSHNELATITGNDRKTFKLPLHISPAKSLTSSDRSSSPVLQSSPLRTSPVSENYSTFKSQDQINNSNATIRFNNSYAEGMTLTNIMSSPYSSNVNPSLLQSSPPVGSISPISRMNPPTTPKVAQSNNSYSSSMVFTTPTSSLRKLFGDPPSTPTHFSNVLNSSPMYTHWYSQTPQQQNRITSTPTSNTNLVPKQLKVEDIIKTPQGGLRIRSEQSGVTVSNSLEFASGLGISSKIEKRTDKATLGNKDVGFFAEQLKTKLRKTQSLPEVPALPRLNINKDTAGVPSAVSPNPQKHRKQSSSKTSSLNENIQSSSSSTSHSVSLLPSNLEVGIQIDADGKATVVTKRRKISIPSSPYGAISQTFNPRTPLINSYNYNIGNANGFVACTPPPGLKIGIDPFVNGISSNEFESYPQQQQFHIASTPGRITPGSKIPFSPTQDFVTGTIHQQLQAHILNNNNHYSSNPDINDGDNEDNNSGIPEENTNAKSDARFALQALLDEM